MQLIEVKVVEDLYNYDLRGFIYSNVYIDTQISIFPNFTINSSKHQKQVSATSGL